jgi:hypothetical protein
MAVVMIRCAPGRLTAYVRRLPDENLPFLKGEIQRYPWSVLPH